MEETKKWYKSKTIWVNVITLVALFAQMQFGFLLSGEEQAAIVVIINLVLRAITKSGLEQ